MKKAGLLLTLGVALVMASAAAPKANAGVVVGVAIGAPVYVHPVRAYGYFAPRYFAPGPYVAFGPAPVYPRVYIAPAPVYYRSWYPRRYVARRAYYGCRR
jgi:hypothetical protein